MYEPEYKAIIVVFQIGALSNYLSDQLIDYEMIGASGLSNLVRLDLPYCCLSSIIHFCDEIPL